ncbi:hypothetical protein [Paraburkholderia caribensis]|uniref:hypothetical protein n=1 Tax=Paraburkholderia caribensis TaxID=75105 RepID=UPI00078C6F19|nr:hypothetical protein [Paraburkholderia caribensis]AMV48524.1 hypothetical protein ATN79_48655 [Paraburkholderia caribensis]
MTLYIYTITNNWAEIVVAAAFCFLSVATRRIVRTGDGFVPKDLFIAPSCCIALVTLGIKHFLGAHRAVYDKSWIVFLLGAIVLWLIVSFIHQYVEKPETGTMAKIAVGVIFTNALAFSAYLFYICVEHLT